VSVEVLDNGGDLNAIISNCLGQNGLVSLVCDEGRAMLVKNETGGLATSGESLINLTLLDLVNVAIGRNRKEVPFAVLGRAVERHCKLENFFKVRWGSVRHFVTV